MVNFFATWCRPCLEELPQLEKEVWQRFKNKEFELVVIGREENVEKLIQFKNKHKFTFPLAPDPKGEIYSRYAKGYIPRNYVINKDGDIIFQSIGFSEDEFKALVRIVEKALQ